MRTATAFPALILLLSFALIAPVACNKHASVSENQCIAGDWETLGYRDGVEGYRTTRLLAHQDACVGHGVIPDRASYVRGWSQGIEEYCQPDNGFNEGARGALYNNVCPEAIEAAFLGGYEDGRELYSARVAVSELENRIQASEGRLEHIQSQIVRTTTGQFDPTLSPAQRIEGMARTKRLIDERVRIELELPELRKLLDQRVRALARIERSFAGLE